MAKAPTGKSNQKFEEFERPKRGSPQICPYCEETKTLVQVNNDYYRCSACGKAVVFGYFYELWLAKYQLES